LKKTGDSVVEGGEKFFFPSVKRRKDVVSSSLPSFSSCRCEG